MTSYRPPRKSGLVAPVSPRVAKVMLVLLPERVVWSRTRNLPADVRAEVLATWDTLRAAALTFDTITSDTGIEQDDGNECDAESVVGNRPAGVTHEGERPLTTGDAAGLLRVTPRRVRQLLVSGRLTGTRHGRSWTITEQAVNDYQQMMSIGEAS